MLERYNLDNAEAFFKNKDMCGHEVTLEDKEVWLVELDLLAKLLEVCKKYDIHVMADGGTLLGAVRHGGFIPWDDDIDVLMPRDEFNKLCAVAKEEFKEEYFFQTMETDVFSKLAFGRLCNSNTMRGFMYKNKEGQLTLHGHYNHGISIDIFPFDVLPNDDNLLKQLTDKNFSIKKEMKLHVHEYYKNEISKEELIKILTDLYHEYIANSTQYNNMPKEEIKLMANLNINPFRDIFKKKAYMLERDHVVYLPFEDLMIPCTSDYEDSLVMGYGKDWKVFKKNAGLHAKSKMFPRTPYIDYCLEKM